MPKDIMAKWSTAAPGQQPAIKLEAQRTQKIQVVFDGVTIKVNGKKVATSNLIYIYKGTTYAPLRAVSEMLGLPVNFHAPTSTAYIGKTPENLTFGGDAKNANASSGKLYHVPATGEMQGWQMLKGHEYEGKFELYFQVNGSRVLTHIKDVRKIDLNRKVKWVDDNGVVHYNTVGELYEIFGEFSNRYTDEWLYEKFGDVYADWLLTGSANVSSIIDRYLWDKGLVAKPHSGATLTPDTRLPEPEPVEPDPLVERIPQDEEGLEESEKPVAELDGWISAGDLASEHSLYLTRVTDDLYTMTSRKERIGCILRSRKRSTMRKAAKRRQMAFG